MTDALSLDLREATASSPVIQDDGTLLIHMIRPCIGRGKGRHVYEAEMLERNASKLAGWRMFVDHEGPNKVRERGGLPRSMRDLGGRVLESYWDASVPADGRFGQGAVVGRVKPTSFVRQLIEDDPEIVEASINAKATNCKPTMRDGQRAWIVEGIEEKGTVDWVTEGGAGGKVAALMESVYTTPEAEEAALFDSLTDEELRARIAADRPGVLTETPASTPAFEPDAEVLEALIVKLEERNLPRELAEKAARKQLEKLAEAQAEDEAAALAEALAAETDPPGTPAPPKDRENKMAVTPEEIQEALLSDDVAGYVRDMVEAAVSDTKDRIRAEASADATRMIELRDMRDRAHEMIAEAKLPAAFDRRLRETFQVSDNVPTEALDLFEAVDAEGYVTETALEVLEGAVESAIAAEREMVASIRPTRVRGQGQRAEVGEDGKPVAAKPDHTGGLTSSMLQEAGFSEPESLWEKARQLQPTG